jgi:hypothetical protein
MAAQGDPANGVACETFLSSVGLNRQFTPGKADKASRGLAPGLVLDLKLIVQVDAKREVFKGLKHLRRALRPCRQQDRKEPYRNGSAHPVL